MFPHFDLYDLLHYWLLLLSFWQSWYLGWYPIASILAISYYTFASPNCESRWHYLDVFSIMIISAFLASYGFYLALLGQGWAYFLLLSSYFSLMATISTWYLLQPGTWFA